MTKDYSRMNKNIPLKDILRVYKETGSARATAKVLGCSKTNVRQRLNAYDALQAGKTNEDHHIPNYAPGAGREVRKVSIQMDKHGTPKGYAVREEAQADEAAFHHPLDKMKRVSTLYGADGSVRAQWQISTSDDENIKEAFDQIVEAFKEDIPRIHPELPAFSRRRANLHNLYVLSDAHIGALAWTPESGADWDLKIAEDMLIKAQAAMIHQSPEAESCTVVLLGDWFHYDKLEAVTTLSGNILDGDGRQPKMNKVAIRVARSLISLALQHHNNVDVLVAEGNHDLLSAPWLRELFCVAYENEPRVRVIEDDRPYYATMIGDVFVGFHHGHLKGAGNIKSAEQLVAIFADEFREMWGQAKKVYIHTGHFHFSNESDVRGARVTQHPTLATRSSWEARRGWGSMREARGSTYHEKYGITGTVNVSPEMLEDSDPAETQTKE